MFFLKDLVGFTRLAHTDLGGYEKLISLWSGGQEVVCHSTGFRAGGIENFRRESLNSLIH